MLQKTLTKYLFYILLAVPRHAYGYLFIFIRYHNISRQLSGCSFDIHLLCHNGERRMPNHVPCKCAIFKQKVKMRYLFFFYKHTPPPHRVGEQIANQECRANLTDWLSGIWINGWQFALHIVYNLYVPKYNSNSKNWNQLFSYSF